MTVIDTMTPAEAELAEPGSQSVSSVGKALQLLDAFATIGPVAGVSELARAAGLPKSTAFRLLNHLQLAGYVEHSGTDYCLKLRVFELGSKVGVCRPDGLRALAAPFVAELFRETSHAAHLAVLDGPEVLYIEKIHGHNAPRVPTTVGGRMPASCTALGKAMLPFGHDEATQQILSAGLPRRTRHSAAAPGLFISQLRRIRDSGVAYDREEAALGVTCVAAPIKFRGTAVAAVSVSGPTSRLDPQKTASRVLRAAAHISALYAKQQTERSQQASA